MPDNQIQSWGDAHQYDAEPQESTPNGVEPKVYLLSMNPDPLGSIAAMSAIYKGKVVRDLSEVTDDEREQAFADVQKTHLKAPLEAVKLHMLIEGVDRAFTHQHVRQRTAVYAQESMRFAVLGDLREATTMPPSIASRKDDDPLRVIWNKVIDAIDHGYHGLVDNGIPSEEARGLLPHCTATRIHYITDLRNLSDHAGNRLCTQAQFHWRLVFARIVEAISEYPERHPEVNGNGWQFEALAHSALFRPVCYQLNYCPFEASFDRSCKIRPRVLSLSQRGVPSAHWDGDIDVMEWMADPGAARA